MWPRLPGQRKGRGRGHSRYGLRPVISVIPIPTQPTAKRFGTIRGAGLGSLGPFPTLQDLGYGRRGAP